LDEFFLANKHINDISNLLESIISIPNNISSTKALIDIEDYVAYLTRKKSITLWDKYFTREGRRFRYIMSKVLLNERNINSVERANLLRDYLSINEVIKALDSIWVNMIDLRNEPIIRKYYLYDNIRDVLSKYLSLIPLLEDSRAKLGKIEPSLIPDWQNLNDINNLQELLILGRENIILDQLDTWFNQKEKYLADYVEHPDSHPICLGINKHIIQKDYQNYRIALDNLSILIKDKEDYDYFEKEYKAMKGNALIFIKYFKDHIKDSDIDHKISHWSSAWYYSSAKAFIDYFLVESNVTDINKVILSYKQKEFRLLESIGSKMAWRTCLSSMSQNEIQNLRAWSQAVKRIGKGTGKYAAKHRRDAQEAMNNCRTAIRAWIMPLFRVVESIQVMPNMFDVIIIDEASQSGPDALYLNYIAKQCIVVGDSEQIAPEAVGYDLQKIYALINEFLFDIPFKERYEPQTSLYAHAEIRYGQRIILNEHFRCMPEIIHFSNDNFYDGKLICLKQYPPARLRPIETVYIKDGYREESSKINRNEAEMLVSKVIECCKSPNYKGKSMGVISLVGNEQANLIDQLLRSQIDVKEINERNLICGDAYSFQGDERDIMFLSMVVDINTHTIATDQKAARRINVAASRARDQSWLFHSIMPQDIGQGSYLHRLLKYYLNPGRIAPEETMADYEEIFESPFEKDVFNAIKRKGYRAIPQYKYAGKRIDLVVVGMTSRIAVECDGDIYHGQERYEDDINRQRLLERCGWTFFRIRGGEYYKNPENSLKPLWQLLKEYSIEPI
jgi:very-short-patch-repair endonuclease